MTTFELRDDYRTAVGEAYTLFGINESHISAAASYHELFANLTPQKRKLAMAAVEVYRQFSYRDKSETIRSSTDVYTAMKPYMQGLEYEEAWAVYLNSSSRIIKMVRISTGGIDCTLVDCRIVLREALLCNAVQFCLMHNHPSGSARPSSQDRQLTENLKNAGKAMNIRLTDHIIYTDSGYYSFTDEGNL